MTQKTVFKAGRVGVFMLLALFFMLGLTSSTSASAGVNLVIDGEKITSSPAPFIKDGRTLVPVRLISEDLGAGVDWNSEDRTVDIEKDDYSVKLRIDNRLVDYKEKSSEYGLSDVPPQIYNSRTFVPLRLVSNALGVSVEWDGGNRTVYINSEAPSGKASIPKLNIASVQKGQTITGALDLDIRAGSNVSGNIAEVLVLLLDPGSGKGPVVARGESLEENYQWVPDPVHDGSRVLAAAAYDGKGRFVAGEVIPVNVDVDPRVSLKGITHMQAVNGTVSLSADINFLSKYVKYEMKNKTTGKTTVTGETDPQGTYSWTPRYEDNGLITIRAIACTHTGTEYTSSPVQVNVNVDKKLELKGVSSGAEVDKPVTLWLSKNFEVNSVRYLVKNKDTGKEKVLYEKGEYSSYRWFPGPELAGTWELRAEVKDAEGNTHTAGPVTVKVPAQPHLYLQGVGPGQVLHGKVNLKSEANTGLKRIEYRLIVPGTSKERTIAGGSDAGKEYSWTPESGDAGQWHIQAVGTTASGETVKSEAVPVRVYTGKIYDTKAPVMGKDQFLDYACGLARDSQEKTGMSAALQTAQAILETGWGQYTPVDKYTGKKSYNLFGIKGNGPAGSVTANTWEEYNGKTFHVDAQFRAYHNPRESWQDHKNLLLKADRYAPFREVMHNSTRGAWALKRAGYATDSQYSLKLINIIESYDLHKLDNKGI